MRNKLSRIAWLGAAGFSALVIVQGQEAKGSQTVFELPVIDTAAPTFCGATAENEQVEKARQQFCDGGNDDYDLALRSVCETMDHLEPGQAWRQREFFWGARPHSTTGQRAAFLDDGRPSPAHLAYLAEAERQVFASQPILGDDGKVTTLSADFLRDIHRRALARVQAEAARVDDASGSLRSRLAQTRYATHAELQSLNATSDLREYGESEQDCGGDGLGVESYASGERNLSASLCPGTVLSELAVFHFYDKPASALLVRLGLTAKIAHELAHSIDVGQFRCEGGRGPYCAYTSCMARKYNTVLEDGALKELVADHYGIEALGRELVTNGGKLSIKDRLKVIYANFRELCGNPGESFLNRVRLREASSDPRIRQALGCGELKPDSACFSR